MRSVQPVAPGDLRSVACPDCGRTPRVATHGFAVLRDREVIGFLALAATDALGVLPRGSVAVEQLWVRPDDRGELVGTQLVQRAAALAHSTGARHVVAWGTRGAAPDCQHLPGGWLDRVGFVEQVRGVQWRLDLRRTITVPDALRAAWSLVGKVVRTVRPMPPAPATRTPASRS